MKMKYISKLSYLLLSFVFLAGSIIFTASPALADSSMAPNSGINPSSSYNWAGYVASSGSYSLVSGSWIVPQVSGSDFSADATWVGIGGISSQDLIQAGTQAIIDGNGQITYQAWYEMLPSVSNPVSMTVNPGDSITSSISETAAGSNQWNVSLRDNTNGQSFSTTVSYNSSLSSAEWIEEMPSQGSGQLIPLDNFGTLQFSNGSTVKGGQLLNIGQSGAQTITMMDSNNQALATVSALNADQASFSVTRTSAIPSSPATNIIGFGRGWRRSGRGVNGYRGRKTGQGGAPSLIMPTLPGMPQQQLNLLRQQLRQFSRFSKMRITFNLSR